MWFWLAAGCGIAFALQGAIAKRSMQAMDIVLLAWGASAFSLPFMIAWLVVHEPLPEPVAPIFYVYLSLNGLMLVGATALYFHAIQAGELSRDMPLLALTPIFMMLTSHLMLGQQLSATGGVAILTVVSGCFALQLKRDLGLMDMLSAPLRERGSRAMLGVALIWSITANMDKLCLNEIGPTWYPPAISAAQALLLLPLLAKHPGKTIVDLKRLGRPLVIIGALQALGVLMQMAAVEHAPHVAYVVTLKRGGLLVFGILLGAWWFGERHTLWRTIGAAMIMTGLGLLALESV